jgi:hypothetical protein
LPDPALTVGTDFDEERGENSGGPLEILVTPDHFVVRYFM